MITESEKKDVIKLLKGRQREGSDFLKSVLVQVLMCHYVHGNWP